MNTGNASTDLPTPSNTEPDAAPSKVRYAVLGWLCAAAAISYSCRLSIGVAESTIRAELGLTKDAMGLVMAFFFLPYALGQIPGGMLSERWGNRRALPFLACGWSAATAAMSLAWSAPLLVAAWLANGLFQAGLFPCCAMAITKWLPAERRAFASGSLASFMSLGGMVGSAAMGLMLSWIGWRVTFVFFGSLGVFWAIEFYLWYRDTPQQHPGVNQAERQLLARTTRKPASTTPLVSPESNGWRDVISSRSTWLICAQQFCRAAGQIFFGSWFATYLQEARGVSVAMSGLFNSLPHFAIVIGSLLGGVISDWVLVRTGSRTLARQGVASTCMFLCAGFVLIAYFQEQPLLVVLTISAGTLLASIGGPSAYAITMDLGGRHVAKLFGCMNMCGNLGAMLFIVGTPRYLAMTGQWNAVLITFGLLWAAAGVFWLLINSNREL